MIWVCRVIKLRWIEEEPEVRGAEQESAVLTFVSAIDGDNAL